MEVAIGIDTHQGSLAAAAVDALGRVLGIREFTNDPTGHRSLLRWVTELGQPRTIGIEGSLSYGSAAARALLAPRGGCSGGRSFADPSRATPALQGQVRPGRRGGHRPRGGGR